MKPRRSCDACRLRKTKCDLPEKQENEKNQARRTSQNTLIRCSFCQSLNVSCNVTASSKARKMNAQIAKHKKGKIIRTLIESNARRDEEGDTFSMNNVMEAQSAFNAPGLVLHSANSRCDGTDAMFMPWASRLRGNEPSQSAELDEDKQIPNYKMFGIIGMSQKIMFACLKGYFDTTERWKPMTQGKEVFLKRTDLLIRQIQGFQEEDVALDEREGVISEILLLAIVARGSLYSPYAFLFRRIMKRFIAETQAGDALTKAGLDGLEAALVIQEIFYRDMYPKAKDGNLPTCLRLDPLGKGFLQELCLFQKLNEKSSPISKSDPERACRLFWMIYSVDGIRSATAHRLYRIQDDDVGWPFPSNVQLDPFPHLARIAREISKDLFSSRIQLEGIQDDLVLSHLNRLFNWGQVSKVPIHLFFLPISDFDKLPEKSYMSIGLATLSALSMRLVILIWIAIQEKRGENLSSSTHTIVEEMTFSGARNMKNLVEICIHENFIDHGSTLMVSNMAHWFLYLIRDIAKADWYEREEIAKVMLKGIKAATQTVGACALADALENNLAMKTRSNHTVILPEIHSNTTLISETHPRNNTMSIPTSNYFTTEANGFDRFDVAPPLTSGTSHHIPQPDFSQSLPTFFDEIYFNTFTELDPFLWSADIQQLSTFR